MTDDLDLESPSRASRRPRRLLALFGLIVLVAAVALIVVLCLRRTIGAELTSRYLQSRGIDSAITLQQLSLHGFSGRLRLGPAKDPDVTAERVDVDLTIAPPWSATPFQVVARRIRLVRPVVKITLNQRGVSLGGLEKLIGAAKPGAPQPPLPDVVVEDGEAKVMTPMGALTLHGGGRIDGGRPVSLDLRTDPTDLKALGWFGRTGLAVFTLHSAGRTVSADLNAPIERLEGGAGVVLTGGKLHLGFKGETPGRSAALELRGQLNGEMSIGATTHGPDSARDLTGALHAPDFQLVQANGAWSVKGAGSLQGAAGALSHPGVDVTRASAKIDLAELELALDHGQWSGAATLDGKMQAANSQVTLAKTVLPLSNIQFGAKGRLNYTPAGFGGRLDATAGARVTLPNEQAARIMRAAPALAEEPALSAALTAALTRFSAQAPRMSLTLSPGAARLDFGAPVSLIASSGARVTLAPIGGSPTTLRRGVLAGAVALTVDGGGLPPMQLHLARYSLSNGAFDGQVALESELNFGPAQQAMVNAAGRIQTAQGHVRFDPAGCAELAAARLGLGDNRIEAPSGRLCAQGGAPLITTDADGWRLQGRLEEVSAASALYKIRVEHVAGGFDAVGGPHHPVTAAVRLDAAEIVDTQAPLRFNPLRATGQASLDRDRWKGDFAIATAKNQPIGAVELRQQMSTGDGQAILDTPALRFANNGLQPADITPLAQDVRSAVGDVRFKGRINWSKRGLTSAGEVSTDGLNITSPLGAVTKIKADIHLTSLTPPIAAPAQVITAQRIEAAVPMEAIKLVFDLDETHFGVRSGHLAAAGGEITIEPMRISLAGDQIAHGAVVLSGVDLGKMVAASSLADKVKLDAVVDGRLPFEVGPGGLKLLKGELVAVRPGRLAIQHDLLAGSTQPNAIQDFAYQALANLAFDSLDATVESRAGGRLGVIFHIKGHHDPAVGQEAYVGVRELANGSAFQKSIPLPKGVPIDLTLDTSLNFDQLLGDYQTAFALGHTAVKPQPRSGAVQR